MRMNRKGSMDLPIKLMVAVILVSLSVPVIIQGLDASETGMDKVQMENESSKIANSITNVYYSLTGSERTVEIEVPQGCHIVLGGDGNDSFGIHMYRNDSPLGTYWLEKPIIGFDGITSISGKTTIVISIENSEVKVRTI